MIRQNPNWEKPLDGENALPRGVRLPKEAGTPPAGEGKVSKNVSIWNHLPSTTADLGKVRKGQQVDPSPGEMSERRAPPRGGDSGKGST